MSTTGNTVTISILHNVPGASSQQVEITAGASENLAEAIRTRGRTLSVGVVTPEIKAAYRAFFAIAAALDFGVTA